MTEDQWNEFLKRSKGWAIRMSFELLHSEAYKKLNYAPALKVLNWFHEKIRVVKVNKRKRGNSRYRILDDQEIDFTYREAVLRGLTAQKFSKALKELHRFGFIEVKRPGSALKGDWTVFAFSERWKQYGTLNFVEAEFPKSVRWINFGFGAKQERKHKKKLDMKIHT